MAIDDTDAPAPYSTRAVIDGDVIRIGDGVPDRQAASTGPRFGERLKKYWGDARDPNTRPNRAGAVVCSFIDRISGFVEGAAWGVASVAAVGAGAAMGGGASPAAPPVERMPDLLGEDNFPGLKGKRRAELNKELAHRGNLRGLDNVLERFRYDPEVKRLEKVAASNPKKGAAMLINWFGGMGDLAPDSYHYDDSYEKIKIPR